MESLLTVALSNALAALVLALAALAASRMIRRPALTHGLWLLVLLKLLTPPLVRLPVPWPPSPVADVPVSEPPAETEREVVLDIRIDEGEADDPVRDPLDEAPPAAAAVPPAPAVPAAVSDTPSSPIDWPAILVAMWVTGSLGWMALAATRVRRMRRLLRFARPAPASLDAEVCALAGRLGLRRLPNVRLVPGRVSPMLWSLEGTPLLLLPYELMGSLDGEQRAALLTHELAHLRRRDHWVRWLELLTTALYWWHPVVWLARRELRRAEELCCDAWVVWALPGAGRAYAAALLDCVDFLSDAPHPLPVGASGLGHVDDLKRRMTMILNGSVQCRLTRGGFVALLALAALLLPTLPTLAQDRGRDTPPPDERKTDKEELDKARAEVEKLRDELAQQMRKVKAAEDRLREAAERLGKLEGKEGGVRIIIIRDGEAEKILPRRELELQREFRRFTPPAVPTPPTPPGAVRPIPARPPLGGVPGVPPVLRGGDDRMRDLERRLEELTRELEEVRRQMRGPRPGDGEPSRPRGPRPTPAPSSTRDPSGQGENSRGSDPNVPGVRNR